MRGQGSRHFYVPIVPKTDKMLGGVDTHNTHIQVGVYHRKGDGVEVSFMPGISKSTAGFSDVFETGHMMNNFTNKRVKLVAMPRFNAKRFDSFYETVKAQINERSGEAYDALVKFCQSNGYELPEATAAAS